ncbi:uncharacterized protein LOC142625178 [Castanea sativa]|uniref:uncharacterized protein LOC142625178 n=1 Tax=Castanea sativa TaxID=21020 RepID=UPI003F651D09
MAIALLHDMMHNEVKLYLDDMIVKSKERKGLIINLRKFFEKIKEYRLRLNLQKCTFGVITGKLLGFLKLRHIILPFQIWVVVRIDPLMYLFEKSALSRRLSWWLILLEEFDLKYVTRETIKGSIISDFCAKNPVEGEDGKEDFSDEDIMDMELRAWKMYFDRAVNQYGYRIGILLITPEGSHIPLVVKLNLKATNNMAKYEAYIAGMEALRELGVKEAEVFGNSTLVIAQAQRLWKVKEEHLKPYQQYLKDLTKTFDKIEYTVIPKLRISLQMPWLL